MAVIVCDTREQKSGHVDAYFDSVGVQHVRSKLIVGDYARLDNQTVAVDRKQHLQECCGNVCQQHERFRAECALAQSLGIRLVILIEHSAAVKTLDDVRTWVNPRLKTSPKAVTGARLAAIMETMADKYGVEWRFCRKQDTGRVVCEILGVEVERKP